MGHMPSESYGKKTFMSKNSLTSDSSHLNDEQNTVLLAITCAICRTASNSQLLSSLLGRNSSGIIDVVSDVSINRAFHGD